jgi:prevent-host-death family protein
MKIQIGAYEAKTRLPELLREVKAGKQFTITNRGEAIADLVPSAAAQPSDRRAAIDKFQSFMERHPVRARANVKKLIREGRL